MEAPTVSKKQQKRTLSGKKAPKETVKNILVNPYTTHFPILQEKDAKTVRDLLGQLPRIRQDRPKVPWSVIKSIPREQRKKFREEFCGVTPEIVCDDIKSDIIFGVNDTTKSLESNKAAAVLLSSDVNPRFMIKHVVDLCVMKDVPVLAVPDLSELLRGSTGIKSVCVAFVKSQRDLTRRINDVTREISANYPAPKELTCNSNKLDLNLENLDLKCESGNLAGEDLKNTNGDPKNTTAVYLYRKDKASRVFIPEDSKPQLSGFIAFGLNDSLEESKAYKGLTIKRVRNNKNRPKKIKLK